MFDPKTSACTGGCSINTTPCPNSQWSQGYPAYGLNGANYDGYSYKTNTGFGVELTKAKDGKYYIEDQINNWTHDGKPMAMFKGMLEGAKTISYLLYDSEDLNKLYDIDAQSGLSTTAVTFKSINNMDIGLSADGLSYVWKEFMPERPVMYVIKDETVPTLTFLLGDANGNPISFDDPKYRNLINVNDRISIRRAGDSCDSDQIDCCSDFSVRAVVAMGKADFNGQTYNTITIEGGTQMGEPEKLTFKGRNGFGGNADLACLNNADKYYDGKYPGDEVRFEFSSFDPCNPVLGGYQLQGYTMKQSNIQYIGTSMSFSWAELRMGYATEGGISAILGERFNAITRSFIEQQARTFWLGENRRYGNAAGIPASTMGLLTEIYAAQAAKPWLRLVRSAGHAVTLEEKALVFMECLMKVQQSKWTKNGKITVVMDDKSISTFYALHKAFRNIGGWQEMLPQTGTYDFSKLPTIRTPWGDMEILQDTFLRDIYGNSGVCVFLDKELIGARQTEEFEVDLTNGSNQVSRKATTGFQIYDITDKKTPQCKEYMMQTSFCYIMAAVDQPNSPYMILENFSL